MFDRDPRRVLDGGWWPRSRDAATELAALVAGLAGPLGSVTRLAVDRDDWDQIPHKITVNGRVVRIGWFDNLNHLVIVTRGRQADYQLLVIPPQTARAAAEAALAEAATGSAGPQQILAECAAPTRPVVGVPAIVSSAAEPAATGDRLGVESE